MHIDGRVGKLPTAKLDVLFVSRCAAGEVPGPSTFATECTGERAHGWQINPADLRNLRAAQAARDIGRVTHH